jgi:hypothetical protein
VYTPRPNGSFVIKNNIFWRLTNGGYAFNIGTPQLAAASVEDYNLIEPTALLSWGWGTTGLPLATFRQRYPGQGQHDLAADPQFVDAARGNFALRVTSPAVNTGTLDAVYATFFKLYGVNITKDIAGNLRPQGATYDLGAYELKY